MSGLSRRRVWAVGFRGLGQSASGFQGVRLQGGRGLGPCGFGFRVLGVRG